MPTEAVRGWPGWCAALQNIGRADGRGKDVRKPGAAASANRFDCIMKTWGRRTRTGRSAMTNTEFKGCSASHKRPPAD